MFFNVTQPKFWFFTLYFLVLSVIFYNTRLPQDAYYYLQWSQHLQLSYFDGPPLIAYALRCYTRLFGTQEFTLLTFAFLLSGLTAWVLWQTARLFFDEKTANCALWLWLLSPGVLYFFTLQITYNSLMILFWSTSFYGFGQLILRKKTQDYYYCGLNFGCLLLAQYTGILLLISFLVLGLYYKEYRFIFKNPHFYGLLGLTAVIFSPVLIWNAQHNWISFLFQLHHGFQITPMVDHIEQIKVYLNRNIICYNFSLLGLIWVIGKYKKTILQTPRLGIFLFPTLFILLFFGISAYFSPTQNNWSAPFFFSGSILLAYYLAPSFSKLHSQLSSKTKLIFLLVLMMVCATLIIEEGLGETPYIKTLINKRRGEGMPAAMHELTQSLSQSRYSTKPIFVDSYQLGAHLAYFLNPKTGIYAHTPAGHQYYFWWVDAQKHIDDQPKSFFYMSRQDKLPADIFFHNCSLEQKLSTVHQHLWKADGPLNLFIYNCQNS